PFRAAQRYRRSPELSLRSHRRWRARRSKNWSFLLQIVFQAVEIVLPETAIGPDPIVDHAQRFWLDPVDAFPAGTMFGHHMRLVQHPQMLRDRGTALRELGGKRIDRGRADAQPLENGAPGW